MIGCTCSVCTSSDQRNRRRRCSLYVVAGGTHLVFDTPPDFRDQVLVFGVERLDALFLTHPHADHIFGFDDVRGFTSKKKHRLPVYGTPETISKMRIKFDYADHLGCAHEGIPKVLFNAMGAPVESGSATITPLPVSHGTADIHGYRVDAGGRSLAYIPDCSAIPEETLSLLDGLDVMILDALRPEPHPTHLSIDESLGYLRRIQAGKSLITHITHHSDHRELQRYVGKAVTVPWDGYTGVL